jgi:UDP-N-acetyl-D-mannosaminuronate dehydrogenase
MLVVLTAVPLIGGAPIADAALLFAIIGLGFVGVACAWRQGRAQADVVRA